MLVASEALRYARTVKPREYLRQMLEPVLATHAAEVGAGERSDVTEPAGPAYSMSRAEFEEAVGDALDAIPARFTKALDDVVILVEDNPPANCPPNLLGLYEGVPLTKRDDGWAMGALPDRITIFRNPILAISRTRHDVVSEVAITVVHEIAHYYGISDERLHELGWG